VRHLKLQPPPRPRVRVRDLARELELADTELLTWLREHGEWVPHVLSYLEEPVAAKARAALRPDLAATAKPTQITPATSDPAPLKGLSPPTTPPTRENNPYLGQLQRFGPRPGRPRTLRAELVGDSGADPLPDYSAAGSFRASEAMAPFEWAVRGVEDQRQDWLEHGLGPRDARIAEACQEAGLQPADLPVDVAGWTVLDRITRGEPPREVARLLRRQRDESRDSG
jgi:hypothetical protein